MAMQTRTNPASVADQYRIYFQKKLLQHAVQLLMLNDYAQKGTLPTGQGADTVRFFQRNVADATKVTALTEGVAINTFREVDLTHVDVQLAPYGEVAKISDVLTWTQFFDTMRQSIDLMGEDCALQADGLTRNEIVTNVTAAGQRRYAQGIADFTTLAAASVSAGRFVANDGLDAVTQLKINRAPKINGAYVGIVPPQVSRDLQDDDKWVRLSQYSNATALYKGEVGMLYGVRYVEATNPFIELATQNTYNASGGIFTSIITGMGAYGVTNLTGQSPFSPKIIIVDKPDSANPLAQFILAGWKAFWATKLLNQNYCCTIRSKTGFGS